MMPDLARALAPMTSRIRLMIGRAVIAAVNDATRVQSLQLDLLADETLGEVEHFQGYGLTSNPPVGLEALVAFVGGTRSHGVVVAVGDRQYRLRGLEQGEVALYDDQGQVVRLGRDGVLIQTDKPVRVEGETVTVIADRVDLGGEDGPAVARVGDPVAGGVIQAGSSKVFAA